MNTNNFLSTQPEAFKQAALAALGSMLLLATQVTAQVPPQRATHGGALGKAAGHFIEMVSAGDEMRFYLLDAKWTTLPTAGVTAIRPNRRAMCAFTSTCAKVKLKADK